MTVTGPSTSSVDRQIGGGQSANLGDILERVLDKGLVIAGDIRVNLLDIELLTVKLRLVVASLETAKEVGIDWWEHDPWLRGRDDGLERENRRLRARLAELEDDRERAAETGRPARDRPAVGDGRSTGAERASQASGALETGSDD